MNIEDLLRQLHDIQPDIQNARVSRARIISTPRRPARFTPAAFMAGVFRSGSAMAFASVLLLVAIGGFSFWKLLGPLTGLDSASLRAEAQAIDIQIHMADLRYQDVTSGRDSIIIAKGNSFNNPKGTGFASDLPLSTLAEPNATSTTGTDTANSTSTASSTVSTVADVLDILSR